MKDIVSFPCRSGSLSLISTSFAFSSSRPNESVYSSYSSWHTLHSLYFTTRSTFHTFLDFHLFFSPPRRCESSSPSCITSHQHYDNKHSFIPLIFPPFFIYIPQQQNALYLLYFPLPNNTFNLYSSPILSFIVFFICFHSSYNLHSLSTFNYKKTHYIFYAFLSQTTH